MESKDKYIFLLIFFLFLFVIFMLGVMTQNNNSKCYAGDPPDPTPPEPTPCCPDGSHQEATYTDPKLGLIGAMTDVHINYSERVVDNENLCFGIPKDSQYEADFSASGGSDSDVCIDDEDGKLVKTYGVSTRYNWSGAPGEAEGSIYHFRPPLPNEGALDEHTLTVESEDYGDCNVDDPNKSASVNLFCYFPYKKGPAPEGSISEKPEPLVWSNSPTYKWNDQEVYDFNLPIHAKLFHGDGIKDLDNKEENPCEYNPPKAEWDDGQENDTPGYFDVTWKNSAGADFHGTTASLDIPEPPVDGSVKWTIKLKVNDDAYPYMADDEETEVDNAEFRVYYDHLARDTTNQSDLNTQNNGNPIIPNNACIGAANHARYGTTSNNYFWASWDNRVIYIASSDNPNDPPELPLITDGLSRKDIFIIEGSWHVSTCTNGTSVWEFGFLTNPNRWGVTRLEEYIGLQRDGIRVVKKITQYYS